MPRPHYTPSGEPRKNLFGSSQRVRDEFKRVEDGIGEMNKYPITIFMPDLKDETLDAQFIMPFACRITAIVAVTDSDVEAGFSIWIRVSHTDLTRVNWKVPGSSSATTLHFVNGGSPAGTTYPAGVAGDGTEVFAEGERAFMDSSSGSANVTPAQVTLQLERLP